MRLECGDCFDLFQTIESGSIDLLLTDPPYGITACDWDVKPDIPRFFQEAWRVLKPNGACVVFGNEPFASEVRLASSKFYHYDWIWDKKRGYNFPQAHRQPMRSHENVCVFYRKQPTYNPVYWFDKPYTMIGGKRNNGGTVMRPKSSASVYRSATENKDGRRFPLSIVRFPKEGRRIHPTQKPVALLEYLIKTYTNENETVLDPFMGVGSTGVACVNTGREFIGFEKEQKFFEIAKTRIEQTQKQNESQLVLELK